MSTIPRRFRAVRPCVFPLPAAVLPAAPALAATALLAVALVAVAPARAGDGRIPLWQPTTIDQSGNYVVTRDIVADGVVFEILPSATAVRIDLNGFTLTSTTTDPVVRAADAARTGTGSRLSIVNGAVVANRSAPAAFDINNLEDVLLQDLDVDGEIVVDRAQRARLQQIVARAIAVQGLLTQTVGGYVRGATLDDASGDALLVRHGRGFLVENVGVRRAGGNGVHLDRCESCIVRQAAVHDAAAAGLLLSAATGGQAINVAVFRALNAFFVDGLSQGNTFRNVTGSFSLVGGRGFLNQGGQTHLIQGTFHGNPAGGIRNEGSELNIRMTVSIGNAPPQFDDQGFATWYDDSNCLGPAL